MKSILALHCYYSPSTVILVNMGHVRTVKKTDYHSQEPVGSNIDFSSNQKENSSLEVFETPEQIYAMLVLKEKS